MTARYFGETDRLLEKYAVYQQNSKLQAQPVGSLKPNDFGLFDLHGNVYSWCHDQYAPYAPKSNEAMADRNDASREVTIKQDHVLRGGSFDDQASYIRSAYRYYANPMSKLHTVGMRVARTMPRVTAE